MKCFCKHFNHGLSNSLSVNAGMCRDGTSDADGRLIPGLFMCVIPRSDETDAILLSIIRPSVERNVKGGGSEACLLIAPRIIIGNIIFHLHDLSATQPTHASYGFALANNSLNYLT